MENLVKIKYLSTDEIEDIIFLAQEFKSGKSADFKGRHVALMFFENSTRTRFSFECAINSIGAHPYIFDGLKSSVQKGEDMFDTFNNLASIGIDTFIVRTTEENFIEKFLEKSFYKKVHFINAGEGKAAHPTQALLDYMTMKEIFNSIKDKKVAIIGDIRHSRVAKSDIALLTKFGAKVVTCAPEYFAEKIEGAAFEPDLKKALSNANVVICLRIQNERLDCAINKKDFIKNYQINDENFPKGAILMHPGPINRDVEISNSLLNSKIGNTILKQAENGKYLRMAVLEKIFKGAEI